MNNAFFYWVVAWYSCSTKSKRVQIAELQLKQLILTLKFFSVLLLTWTPGICTCALHIAICIPVSNGISHETIIFLLLNVQQSHCKKCLLEFQCYNLHNNNPLLDLVLQLCNNPIQKCSKIYLFTASWHHLLAIFTSWHYWLAKYSLCCWKYSCIWCCVVCALRTKGQTFVLVLPYEQTDM